MLLDPETSALTDPLAVAGNTFRRAPDVGLGRSAAFYPARDGLGENAGEDRLAATAEALADLAVEALLREVHLTPKPGLVDLRNTGSHRDMTVDTFVASAGALRPGFAAFFRVGAEQHRVPATAMLDLLRPTGLACERAMFTATGGVNTHKGSIFAFGLLLGAAGRLWARNGGFDGATACAEVAAIAEGLVERELAGSGTARTAGERLFRAHGLTGARGEAVSGFALVREGALPVFERALARGHDEATALSAALLHLLEHNDDTNIAARGGLEGLAWAKAEARGLARAGGIDLPDFRARMEALDDAFIARNLSPGGSADLLAITWMSRRMDVPWSGGPCDQGC